MTREITREEVIKNIKEHCYFASLLPQAKDALDMAIKALEQEPCDDAISRQAVLDVIERELFKWDVIDEIRKLPTVNPQPKTGRWISFGTKGEIDGQIVRTFICSECGAISIFRVTNGNIVNGDLCPNCGAKMVEPQERRSK